MESDIHEVGMQTSRVSLLPGFMPEKDREATDAGSTMTSLGHHLA